MRPGDHVEVKGLPAHLKHGRIVRPVDLDGETHYVVRIIHPKSEITQILKEEEICLSKSGGRKKETRFKGKNMRY